MTKIYAFFLLVFILSSIAYLICTVVCLCDHGHSYKNKPFNTTSIQLHSINGKFIIVAYLMFGIRKLYLTRTTGGNDYWQQKPLKAKSFDSEENAKNYITKLSPEKTKHVTTISDNMFSRVVKFIGRLITTAARKS